MCSIHCSHTVHLMTAKTHDFYRRVDCMKKFCADLRKDSADIINYKKMLPLTN